mmetsp:Transcript_24068/g.44426  ORF Transcript_24068/g.44426 Transcript_24068/m.44426 type:complete len:615 (-) Transcript_24068:1158-3002(-)
MSVLSPIRKYVTLDQLYVFKIFFESAVVGGASTQEARARVKDYDAKRDTSSVSKVVDALNSRFETVFEQPLIKRTDDDNWVATALGHEVFAFAKTVFEGLTTLEHQTEGLLPGAQSVACYVRSSLTSRLKWLRELARDQSSVVDLKIRPYQKGNLLDAFADPEIKFVLDQLFITDKRNLPSNEFVYFPLRREPILVGISREYRSLLEKSTVINGVKVIDISYLSGATLLMLNEVASIRAALAIANRAIAIEDYTGIRAFSEVEAAFPHMTVLKDDLDEVAFSMEIDPEHAFFGDARTIRRASETLGFEYEVLHTAYKGMEQYSHEAVIVRDELARPGSAGQLEGLVEQFRLARGTFFRESKGDETFLPTVNVSDREIDYDRLFFSCSGCGKPVYYDDEIYPVIKECTNCMRVQKYDANEPDKDRQVTTYFDVQDIRYVEFHAEETGDPEKPPKRSTEAMHCSRPQCGTLLDEEISYSDRNHAYKICANCHQIYQPKEAEQETVYFDCPTDPGKCGKTHSVRVSGKKTVVEYSCYNSRRLVRYDHKTGFAEDVADLEIKEVRLARPTAMNVFACPHLGCGTTMRRKMIKNKRGEGYSHCRSCGNDIRIIQDDGAD